MRKNNWDDITTVFIQVKVWLKIAWADQKAILSQTFACVRTCTYVSNVIPVILPAYATYDDGTDRVFRNVWI